MKMINNTPMEEQLEITKLISSIYEFCATNSQCIIVEVMDEVAHPSNLIRLKQYLKKEDLINALIAYESVLSGRQKDVFKVFIRLCEKNIEQSESLQSDVDKAVEADGGCYQYDENEIVINVPPKINEMKKPMRVNKESMIAFRVTDDLKKMFESKARSKGYRSTSHYLQDLVEAVVNDK